MRRFFKKKDRFRSPEITLTPLIDTSLTLLIIFLVTAPMVQNGIKIELPQGSVREVAAEQDFVLAITHDQQFFFNSFPIKKNELIPLLQKTLAADMQAPLFIKADERLTYGTIISIIDDIKSAGIQNVALTTKKHS